MPNSTIEPVLGEAGPSFVGGWFWSGVVPLRLIEIDPAMGPCHGQARCFLTVLRRPLLGVVVFRYFSTESLILAQDERWRRA
jgi:hypothetical protein